MSVWLVVLLVVLALAFAAAAWKLPKLRAGLAGAAFAIAGLAVFFAALLSAKGDIKTAVRQVKAKRKIKQAVTEHKESMEVEKTAVEEAQEELEKIVETDEETPDLQELADKFNDRFSDV